MMVMMIVVMASAGAVLIMLMMMFMLVVMVIMIVVMFMFVVVVFMIENEFGEVGIDGGFLKDAGIEITEMNSGCICCSLVGDFGKNLHEVIDKYHPDRILIEPSGVGKLSDVMKSVIDIEKEEDVKLNGLVTVVNALKASKQMKAFGEFFNNQIEYATVVVLSRSQNATPEQLELCVKQIQSLNPKAAIITTAWDAIKSMITRLISGLAIYPVRDGNVCSVSL